MTDKAQIAFGRHTSEHVVVAVVGALWEGRTALCAPGRDLFVVYLFLSLTKISFRTDLSRALRPLHRQASLPPSRRKLT